MIHRKRTIEKIKKGIKYLKIFDYLYDFLEKLF